MNADRASQADELRRLADQLTLAALARDPAAVDRLHARLQAILRVLAPEAAPTTPPHLEPPSYAVEVVARDGEGRLKRAEIKPLGAA